MAKQKGEDNAESIRASEAAGVFPFILGSLAGMVAEFQLQGVTLQRVSQDDFRCILRGYGQEGDEASVRVVSFTNARTPEACLASAEGSFGEGTIRWHVDRYAGDDRADGASEAKPRGLTFRD